MSYRNRIAVCALILSLAMPLAAQQRPSIQDPMQIPDATTRSGRSNTNADRTFEELEREQAKKRNKERQENLQKDTQRLLDLATELKKYVDTTNEHVLSLDVMKKCDEIEKLAKSVKSKMRGE